MIDGIRGCSTIYIYSYGGLNGFRGGMGWISAGRRLGGGKTGMLFQNEKTVLLFFGGLNEKSRFSVCMKGDLQNYGRCL
jgi:hypothetical protein